MRKRKELDLITKSAGVGLLLTGFIEVGTRLDKFLNPQIFEALEKHMGWWQLFTTDHAASMLYLKYEPASAIVTLALLSIGAALTLKKN